MKNSTRLALTCTLAFLAPVASPARQVEGRGFQCPPYGEVRNERLGVSFNSSYQVLMAPFAGCQPVSEPRVTATDAGGPLESVCFPGDLILSINGVRTPTIAWLQRTVDDLRPGAWVTFQIKSGDPPYATRTKTWQIP